MSERTQCGGGVLEARADERLSARVVSRRPLPSVTAGSALIRVGKRLLAVHDDAFRATWVDPATLTCESWCLSGDGAALSKPLKPDFEAAAITDEGVVYLLGSGSRPQRCGVARLDVAGHTATLADRTPLYQAIRRALALATPPNIEGAVIERGRLSLVHRGVGGQRSACVTLAVRALDGDTPEVLDIAWLSLGMLEGVPLGCTDLALGEGSRRFFVAAAEDTADAVADGVVVGSVLGIIADRAARWAAIVDERGRLLPDKVEGLIVDRDARGAWLLTDADDPLRPAELYRVALAGPWLAD